MNIFDNITILYILCIITILQFIYLHYINNVKLIVIYIFIILTGYCINDNLIKILLSAFVLIYLLMGLKILYTQEPTTSPIYHIIKDANTYNEPGITLKTETQVNTEIVSSNFDIDAISKWNSMIPIVE